MSQRIIANGHRIHYRFDGPRDGPVVMLSNSLGSSTAMWDDQIDALTERYRVLRYDTRGHGDSEVTRGPYSIDLLARDARALLKALSIERLHYVGLSMGGMIGQRLAASWPDMLRSLTLCDTASEMNNPDMWAERVHVAEEEGLEASVDGTMERWFTAPFRAACKDEVARVAAQFRKTPVEGYVGCCHAIAEMNQTAMLAQIVTPTLVIVGADDPATPVAEAERLHAGIAGSALVVLENAAHLSNIEQADGFNRVLREFLDRH